MGIPSEVSDAKQTRQKELCFHCGEVCPDPPVETGGKPFCCEGCSTVYEILQENDLCRYYDLESRPGISLRERQDRSGRFAYLDDPALQRQLLDFGDDSIGKITLRLPQIHCASCVWLLENLNRLEKGILEAEVDFLRREIGLTYAIEEIGLRQVVELLAGLGYEPEITLGSTRPQLQKRRFERLRTRGATQRLAVAGFCFGNVMLFSFPEYLAGPGELAEHWRTFFAVMNVLLALPVLLYSSTEYLGAAWNSLKQRTITIDVPISLGIAALFGRSLFEVLSGTGSGYMDSFTGLIFFLLIGKLFQRKTFASLSFDRDYRSYFPLAVAVREGGEERAVPVADLEVGQTILVRNEELIPADCCLHSPMCRVDYSYVTGEAEPVDRERGEILYAGGRVVGTAAEMTVVKEVSQSYLTRLWNHEAFRKEEGEELNQMVNAISRYFTGAVLAIAFLAALFWLRTDPMLAVNAFTSVLIIACPCALALSTPFALGTAINLLARVGFFLKHPGVVERLARIDAIVFDKTGTLTTTRASTAEFVGQSLEEREKRLLAAALRNSTHPLSRKLLQELPAAEGLEVIDYRESPGRGLRCEIDGQMVLVGSRQWLVENEWPESELPEVPIGTSAFVAIDGREPGYFRFGNAYRSRIGSLFVSLRRRFELFLLSGDNDRERERLLPYFEDSARMHFDQSPTDKLEFVARLQREGRQVLMIGDGLNDAGALRQSAVGIAVAEGAFSPASDGILDAERLAELPLFLRFGRACMWVVGASFALSISYNIIGISFAVQGTLSPLLSAVLMPLSSVSVIAFTTMATRLAARQVGIPK